MFLKKQNDKQAEKRLRDLVVDTLNRRVRAAKESFVTLDGDTFAIYRHAAIEVTGEHVNLYFSLDCPQTFAAKVGMALTGFHPNMLEHAFIVSGPKHAAQIIEDNEAMLEWAADLARRNGKVLADHKPEPLLVPANHFNGPVEPENAEDGAEDAAY